MPFAYLFHQSPWNSSLIPDHVFLVHTHNDIDGQETTSFIAILRNTGTTAVELDGYLKKLLLPIWQKKSNYKTPNHN